MSPAALFYPVLAQVALTFVLLFVMGRARVAWLKATRTHPSKIALGENIYPDSIKKIQNAFHNQLQLPILFYAVCVFAIMLNRVDAVLVGLAWAYVTLRIAHAVVHTGSNKLPSRAILFAVGATMLLAMWVWLAVKVAI